MPSAPLLTETVSGMLASQCSTLCRVMAARSSPCSSFPAPSTAGRDEVSAYQEPWLSVKAQPSTVTGLLWMLNRPQPPKSLPLTSLPAKYTFWLELLSSSMGLLLPVIRLLMTAQALLALSWNRPQKPVLS